MGSPDLNADGRSETTGRHLLVAAFGAAIFVSAALLFVMQPMFTKMVLPDLGGAPAVWSVAIVFFQAALLCGYAYAHALTSHVSPRTAVLIHLALMVAAAVTLPLAIAPGWGRAPLFGEAFWLLGLFAVSIGLPFFALAANAPLLQAWFARTGHPAAKDPYFLYAASNVGSFLALLSYPVLLEPLVRLTDQTRLWSIGFCGLIVLIAGCGALLWRTGARPSGLVSPADADAAAPPPTWRDAARWTALASVPCALLVAVTAHISTDVAAVPLLWVLPLALYLLTFVIVFSPRPLIPHWLVVEAQPAFVIALIVLILFEPIKDMIGQIAVHVAVFFVCALMCHGELARRRPAAKHLTAFYLWVAAGGMIGGIAAALVAPHVFDWVAEYPILIALTLLCRPGLALPQNRMVRYALFVALAAVVLVLVALDRSAIILTDKTFNWTIGALLVASVLVWRMPLPFAALVAFVLMAGHVSSQQDGSISVRSFFGIFKITESRDGQFRLLQHGTTLHGAQRIRDLSGRPVTGPPEPLLYYHDGSAIVQTIGAVRARLAPSPVRIAMVGLGSGSLACQAAADDRLEFFDIDPAIIPIARNPQLFTFLSSCRPDAPVTLGDARLTLAEVPDGSYDLIIVDAFTSDAIPLHLLTREAMAIYLRKLNAHGMVTLHISNRQLELASVVVGIAAANGALTRVSNSTDFDEANNPYKYATTVAAVVRSEADFGTLAQNKEWELKQPDPRQWVWTDDYTNILGALLRSQER